MLTFLHISDTHISADPEYGPHWLDKPLAHPNRGVEALLAAIGALSFPVDFILHTGDICAEPELENYSSGARNVRPPGAAYVPVARQSRFAPNDARNTG